MYLVLKFLIIQQRLKYFETLETSYHITIMSEILIYYWKRVFSFLLLKLYLISSILKLALRCGNHQSTASLQFVISVKLD